MTDKLLAAAEAARLLGVSVRSLERWRTTGEGPVFVRLGQRRVAYPPAAINDWLGGRSFAHRAAEAAAKTKAAA